MTLKAFEALDGKTVSVLGTDYTIRISVADEGSKNVVAKTLGHQSASMLTQLFLKEIWCDINAYIDDGESQVFGKDIRAIDEDLTHELYHAFYFESGLDICTDTDGCSNGWVRNETMIDWNAKQFHKISKARRELGIKDQY